MAEVVIRLVRVDDEEVSSVVDALVTERLEMVVVARVEVPITSNVPEALSDEVAVIDPPVIDEEKIEVIYAVTPLNRAEKRLDVDAVVAVKVVAVALLNIAVLLFRFVIVPEAEVRLVVDAVIAERLEMVVVAKSLIPNHVLLAFIIPKVEEA